MGTIIRPLTLDTPKCLVEVSGKSILDHQLTIFRKLGLDDISIVGGYLIEKIRPFGLNTYFNKSYSTSNMVCTLFCARELFDGSSDILISYGDILFEKNAIEKLQKCQSPLSLISDCEWLRYWKLRMDDPLQDAETFKVNEKNHITELGRKPVDYHEINGQFVGLIKVSRAVAPAFLQHWDNLLAKSELDAKKMFMTDFLQSLIDDGFVVEACFVRNGWAEIDSPSDIEAAKHFWNPLD